MELTLSDDIKAQYSALLKSATEVESSIGSTQYRIHKLMLLREDVDKGLKVWWDSVIKELNLDPKKNYMVDAKGTLQLVEQPNASVKTVLTVDDLK